jgi:hypothetical protein
MAVIVLRSVKGSPLTIAEADANFNNLNTEVGSKLDSSTYTAADVLSKLLTVDGSGSGLDADRLDGLQSATANTVSTIVARDASGNFAAGTITATLVGNVTGNVTGTVTGTISGNATNVSGVVAIGNGGTGATSDSAARTALGLGTIATQAASNVTITGGSISGITDIAIADGGTGASTVVQARTNLGLVLGSDVQPFSNNLTALAAVTTHGFFVKDSAGTALTRSIAASGSITVTNGDGVSGNPTITLSSTPEVSAILKTGTNGSGDIGQSGNRFAVIYGTSTSAQYADLAEKYLADAEYAVGTVMMVGGDAEVTASTWGSRAIGVVSANPAYIMNDDLEGGTAIALKGRVPVRVIGAIRKGDRIIASAGGLASAGIAHSSDVIGIALESNSDMSEKLVECVIL